MSRQKLLLVAYHFPPIQGSTGTSRTVAFSKYLRDFGWEVCVLTINASAYEFISKENESLVPKYVRVHRAWGLDALRNLSVFGKYPLFLALPDRWQSWIVGAIFRGSAIIRDWRPDVIMTTYPIPSAHVIGWILSKKFNVPWVAEFRDPMLQSDYPAGRWKRWAFEKIENIIFSNAKEIVVTTDSCRKMYLERYPRWKVSHITTVSNGFDPSLFGENIKRKGKVRAISRSNTLVLLHSGLLYPSERNPSHFFHAVRFLLDDGFFQTIDVEFRFRASGNEERYIKEVDELGIGSYIRFLPQIPYTKAIEEMTTADALMIFQASNCNSQIPAKVYEYMICQRPIFALTDIEGETGRLLRSVGVESIASLDKSDEIKTQLRLFLRQLQKGETFVVAPKQALKFSRASLTGEMSTVLERAIAES